MVPALWLVALAMILGGAYAMVVGFDLILVERSLVERGWVTAIVGGMAATGGVLVGALAVVAGGIKGLRRDLARAEAAGRNAPDFQALAPQRPAPPAAEAEALGMAAVAGALALPEAAAVRADDAERAIVPRGDLAVAHDILPFTETDLMRVGVPAAAPEPAASGEEPRTIAAAEDLNRLLAQEDAEAQTQRPDADTAEADAAPAEPELFAFNGRAAAPSAHPEPALAPEAAAADEPAPPFRLDPSDPVRPEPEPAVHVAPWRPFEAAQSVRPEAAGDDRVPVGPYRFGFEDEVAATAPAEPQPAVAALDEDRDGRLRPAADTGETDREGAVRDPFGFALRGSEEPASSLPPPQEQPQAAVALPEDGEPVLGTSAEAAPPVEAEPPPAVSPGVIGTYESGGNTYVMYADGSIEAETPGGLYRFGSLDELKEFIATGGEGARAAG